MILLRRSRILLLLVIIITLLPHVCAAAALVKTGDRGTAVREIQQALQKAGFDPGPLDGIFGPKTLAAVKAFQRSRGLVVDGVVGPITSAALGIAVTLSARSERQVLAGKTVVIDPGHGGHNPGALGVDGSREEDNVLAIALYLRDLLTAAGARVVMTRSTDVEPSLWERVSLANKSGADLFISVHNNSYKDPNVSGVMTFSRPNDARSQTASNLIMEGLKKHTGMTNRGVMQGSYYVLRNTKMPAVIAEIGFMTNWSDVKILKTTSFRRSAAQGLYDGIVQFLTR